MLGSTFQKALGVALAAFIAVGVPAARAQVCINDLQGPDDEPGQKDLSQFCLIGACGGSNTQVTWNLDDTEWQGNNTGANCTNAACKLEWNINSQNGINSVGSMGNAVPIPSGASYDIYQTLSGNYNVAEVGALFPGSGSGPSLTGRIYIGIHRTW